MRFPYKRSVGQDLRDLFQVQRVQSQARNLGHSSIRQGEGAIRLLGTNGATVHAVLGDLPGGGYGLGILSGGVIRTVPEIVSGATGPLSSRIGTLEAFKAYADGQITNLNAANTSNSTRLNSLEAFKTYADNTIVNLLAASNRTGDRLDSLESNRTWQDGQITNINTNLGSLNANRTWADGQITSLTSSVGSLGASVGAVAGRATSLESRANALEFRANQKDQQIAVLEGEIQDLKRRLAQTPGVPP